MVMKYARSLLLFPLFATFLHNGCISLTVDKLVTEERDDSDVTKRLQWCIMTHCRYTEMTSLSQCIAQHCHDQDGSRSPSGCDVIPLPVALRSQQHRNGPAAVCLESFGRPTTFCTAASCYFISHGNVEQLDGAEEERWVMRKRELPQLRVCLRHQCGGEYEYQLRPVDFRRCVVRQCCPLADVAMTLESTQLNDNRLLKVKSRRVNDDVSQCIQSYCSGKLFRERLLCIVKNCNRSNGRR